MCKVTQEQSKPSGAKGMPNVGEGITDAWSISEDFLLEMSLNQVLEECLSHF